MKEAVSRKKDVHKAMRRNSTEENKSRHKEQSRFQSNERTLKRHLLNYKNCPHGMLRLV